MINLSLKNAIKKTTIDNFAEKVESIHKQLQNYELEGNEFLGWMDLPNSFNKSEIKKIQEEAKKLKNQKIEILVVIGIGGSFTGAKAGLDFLQGNYAELKGLELVFAGESLSGVDLAQKLAYVSKKRFAINVISKSGKTLEPAIAFRLFRKVLIEKLGLEKANELIFATTDANKGLLISMARSNNWCRFVIPDNVGGRFSILTAVGLFPLACAGLDILEILEGAREGKRIYDNADLSKNDAYKYAVTRYILGQKYPNELFASYEPKFAFFIEWWRQLFAESEGKLNRGLFPTGGIFTRDLHSIGQFVQEGSRSLFETILTLQEPSLDVKLFDMEDNTDDLNCLSKHTVDSVNKIFQENVTNAHAISGNVPNIGIEIETDNEFHFGLLIYFFERAVTMSAYLIGVNPFNQPGVEVYKNNVNKEIAKLRDKSETF